MFGGSSRIAQTFLRTSSLAGATCLVVSKNSKDSFTYCESRDIKPGNLNNLVRKHATLRKSLDQVKPRRINTKQELSKLRVNEKGMLEQWERDEDGWRDLPARAWPVYQPDPYEVEQLKKEISHHNCAISSDDELCKELFFNVSTGLVFYALDAKTGFEQYEQLAEAGHVDSMVACGVLLLEGIGVDPDTEKGIHWLRKAATLDSAQGCYELGTVFYTGTDEFVEEDPEAAFQLFKRAADQDHTAGLYMMADCLLEGDGTDRDVARAVPLLYRAADRGHRYSRQLIRQLLAKKEYKEN